MSNYGTCYIPRSSSQSSISKSSPGLHSCGVDIEVDRVKSAKFKIQVQTEVTQASTREQFFPSHDKSVNNIWNGVVEMRLNKTVLITGSISC